MNKKFYIEFILLTSGFFLMSTHFGYSCETQSQKSAAKTETLCKTQYKDCCKNHHPNHTKDNCGGNCGNPFCICPTLFHYGIKNDFASLQNEFPIFEKHNFDNYLTIMPKDVCFSIWLPPKINC